VVSEVREMLRPPLPARLRPRDWAALDAAAAVAYLGLLAGWFLPHALSEHQHFAGQPGLPLWLDWVAVLLLTIPVAARRRHPAAALALAAAGAVLSAAGGLHDAPFPSLAYVLYLPALTWSRRAAAGALVLAEAGVAVAYAASPGPTALSPAGTAAVPSLLFTILAQAAAWLIGRTVRQQRAYTRGLAAQAASQAQAEVDAARAAVTEQRLRIARDLHDVVAHSVSLMTVQAGAARMLADSSPGESRQLLSAIEATGRDCLRETRRVLGVLRDDDSPPVAAPGAPGQGVAGGPPSPTGLAELPRLVARSAAAGVTVAVRTQGPSRDLPASLGLTAFRIIQEALTNIVRHSTADHCQVALTYGARELSIEVTNPPSGPRIPPAGPQGSGYGLTGMRERVNLHGGQFSAGPVPGGGFAVTAVMPLPDPAA
jgi:signal transduction histidine kinase